MYASNSTIMETTLVNPVHETDWDELVLAHPDVTFFHSRAWAKVLSKTYGHKPVYLRCVTGGKPLALVPMMDVQSPLTGRRGVCLPFTDFCAPLMYGGSDHALIIDLLCEIARERKWKHFEIRDAKALGPAVSSTSFYGHKLQLCRNPETLFKRLKGAVRTAIRKAERGGLTAEVTWDREAIIHFYRLHAPTRRRHGLPPQPMSFFMNIYDEVIKPRLGFVVLVKSGSEPVAAGVFCLFGRNSIYKFGASDETQRELRGSNLMMWEGIRFLAENGADSLHLGRTSLDNDGLRRFKLGWGTEEEMIEYRKFDTSIRKWVTGRDAVSGFHTAVFSRLPLALNRLAGSILYPHLD
jgi:hypothetical protein